MFMKVLLRVLYLCAMSTAAGTAMAAGLSPEQKSETEQIIRDYLMNNPEILEDMSKILAERQKVAQSAQMKSFLAENSKSVFHQPGDLVLGNPKSKVTIVEFFDYNCGWCKKGLPEVLSLLESDKDLRLVLKEFPIFGEDSEYAARAVIASAQQDKARDMHLALLGFEGKVNKAVVDEAAKAQGLDPDRLSKDMTAPETDAMLARNHELAQSLAINGTPAFIIGDQLVPGYLPKDDLAAAVDGVRKSGVCAALC
jgi:protein-disulfide isomerase